MKFDEKVLKVIESNLIYNPDTEKLFLVGGKHPVAAITDGTWAYVTPNNMAKLKALKISYIAGKFVKENNTFTRFLAKNEVQFVFDDHELFSAKIKSTRNANNVNEQLDVLARVLNTYPVMVQKKLFCHILPLEVDGAYGLEIYRKVPGEAEFVHLMHSTLGEVSLFAEFTEDEKLRTFIKEKFTII